MVSIILVTKNAARTLERCLESVRRQTYRDFEVLVQDGCSTDGTLSILDRYNDLPGFSVVSEPDNSIYHAVNLALGRAQGEFFCFLHSDDFWPDNYLDKVSQISDGLDAVVTGTIRFDDRTSRYVEIKPRISTHIYFGLGFFHPAAIFRKEVFDRVGPFNEKYRIASDVDWLLRALRLNLRIGLSPVNYYMSVSGLSGRQFARSKREYSQILLSHGVIKWKHLNFLLNYLRGKVNTSFLKKGLVQGYFVGLFLFNVVYRLLALNSMRVWYLRFFGNRIGRQTYLSRKIRFLHYKGLTIGDNCVIGSDLVLDSRKQISIGNNVNISNYSSIYSLGHNSQSPFLESKGSPVTIEEDTFIFSHVIVNPGTTIGRNCVVKPGSVLAGSFPQSSIIEGNPGRPVGKRKYEAQYKHRYNYLFRP